MFFMIEKQSSFNIVVVTQAPRHSFFSISSPFIPQYHSSYSDKAEPHITCRGGKVLLIKQGTDIYRYEYFVLAQLQSTISCIHEPGSTLQLMNNINYQENGPSIFRWCTQTITQQSIMLHKNPSHKKQMTGDSTHLTLITAAHKVSKVKWFIRFFY